jgi:hypothetical protein
MKQWALALAIVVASVTGASAQLYGTQSPSSGGLYGTGSNPNSHYVNPYTRNTQTDNYGSRPNVNPYTGQTGTHRPRY